MAILHFSEDELAGRRQRACEKMARQGLDAVLLFKQESMYYLTGYDTGGYSLFQCLILRADGDLVLVTRSADKLQAAHTSMIPDVRIWIDKGGANPAHDVVAVLKEKGLAGKQVGVELHAWCLTGQRWEMVRHALDGFCNHSDATDLIQGLRLIKSPAEMEYVRKAGALCDDALKALNEAIEPGVDEGILYSRMMQAILEGGGDPAASRPIIGSGDGAMLVRYFTGREKVGAQDQVQLEYGAGYRHYHVAIMRTVLTGVAGERCPRPEGLPPQRMRLFPQRQLPALLDGGTHDLSRQHHRDRAGHGDLHAHDPGRCRQHGDHESGRNRNHARRPFRIRLFHAARSGGEVGELETKEALHARPAVTSSR